MKSFNNSKLMHLASMGKRIIYKSVSGETVILKS